VERFDYRDINIDRGMLFEVREKKFGQVERFVNTATGISPRPLLGQDQATYWSTGVEHDSYGQVSEDPQVREQMMKNVSVSYSRSCRNYRLMKNFVSVVMSRRNLSC
jgi:pyruvate/2-oxoacid:ferredoxin oxidoreductase alpha subunit